MRLPVQDALLAALAAKDARRIADLYANDAMFFMPGRPVVEGRDAVERVMSEDLEDPNFSLDLRDQKTEVSASGDMAYARGTFRVSFTIPQTREVQSVGGNYLQVFRKNADGNWKVVEDISSPGAAPGG
jgi:uncharacterized protein (TIGR02246 family)